jgi:CheY-like chemotaxis protein
MPPAPTILIIDDDPQIRKLCKRLLDGPGYCVREAESGKAALATLKITDVDLVLLDLTMPDMDGVEVLREVRRDLPQLKIIVITGFMPETMLKVAKLLGVAATLAKPFSSDSLLAIVSEVLQNKAQTTASD